MNQRYRIVRTRCVCLALAAFFFILGGCGTGGSAKDATTDSTTTHLRSAELRSDAARAPRGEASPEEVEALVGDSHAFALDLLQRLSADGRNLVFSPWGLQTALAMTHDGARGVTQEEIAAALHLSLGSERLPAAMNALDQTLAAGTSPELAIQRQASFQAQ